MLLQNLPITGLTTTFIAFVMLVAWSYVTTQLKRRAGTPQRSVVYLNRYFLFMALFCVSLSIPYLWLGNSADFSLAMAIGYVVGHIFCYIAFMHITRMVCALEPRLVSKDKVVVAAWIIVGLVVTAINAYTMIWGVQPTFDYERNLTEFNANPIVGVLIGLMSATAIIPALILFGISTWKATGANKVKPLLITLGFLVVMVAGPMHDVARSGSVYATADLLSAVSMLILCIGVIYRIEHNLNEARTVRPVVHAPSNTL